MSVFPSSYLTHIDPSTAISLLLLTEGNYIAGISHVELEAPLALYVWSKRPKVLSDWEPSPDAAAFPLTFRSRAFTGAPSRSNGASSVRRPRAARWLQGNFATTYLISNDNRYALSITGSDLFSHIIIFHDCETVSRPMHSQRQHPLWSLHPIARTAKCSTHEAKPLHPRSKQTTTLPRSRRLPLALRRTSLQPVSTAAESLDPAAHKGFPKPNGRWING